MSPVGATLSERGETLPDVEHAAPDPLPTLLPPEGVSAASLRDVAARVGGTTAGRIDVAGIRGCAAAAVVSAVARFAGRRVVLVTHDLESARKLADDVAFWVRGAADPETAEEAALGSVLVFAANESSPYADVNPDRRAAMSRMATLAHLAGGLPWSVLIVPAASLLRKVVPRAVVRDRTERIVVESEIDRDGLVRRLSEAGYLRVPVVEDPGTFAVRGALLDVWPASAVSPVRVELYGDLVLSIKAFDPVEQTTRDSVDPPATLPEIRLPPAREAVLYAGAVELARSRVRQLADMVDMPTSRARALVEDVASGRAFFGAEGFLPAYYGELEPLLAYVEGSAVVAIDDPPRASAAVGSELDRATVDAAAKSAAAQFLPSSYYLDPVELGCEIGARTVMVLHRTAIVGASVGERTGGSALAAYEVAPADGVMDLAAREHDDLSRAVKAARASRGKTATLSPLVRRVAHWQDHGMRVFITARAQIQAERLSSLLKHQGATCRARLGPFDTSWLSRSDEDAGFPTAQVVVGPLSKGVVLPADGLVLVTEEEVFGSRAHRRARREGPGDRARPFLDDLRSLHVGDYVVHGEHGIGRYQGLVHRVVAGLTIDLLVVEYAAGDKLYLPVHRLNQIQKFSGGESATPKLDRLGGTTFAKTKSRARKAVRQMADELLRLYAERKAQPGHALDAAGDDYRAFEATFPYEETVDQGRAIDDVNRDLESDRPMDRLVCGDVGFGKTEVAIRAAYRVAMSGKQVALLCPTTVLAQQHYRVFSGRLSDYGPDVRVMSRFQSQKEQDETLAKLKDGSCDVVIGTHRLLSKDVHFKDLGLLVVDEEQRFGVVHKERIKQLKTQVDVLTLSATPIPRTLQMAVGGLRDLSLINTAPLDRRAVRTIVTRFDEPVIREAVTRELSRGGQVFYVYNRVEGIYERAQRLQRLVPEARIAVGHGQMSRGKRSAVPAASVDERAEGALERVMLDFVEGRHDVLVSTAIVENGLDIPRANTILIDRADTFGLSQLYQLRGRVGRSKERAYCYLIVPPADAITDEARSRIEALERHTELGSGFQIASLDLELRGAGDVLGAAQSGTVAQVGFDLFCQMLDEAVHELRGEEVVHEVDPELSIDVAALLPEDYIGDVGLRLSLYKRLSSAEDEARVADLASEMEDRFGAPPEEARRLVQVMSLKTELRRLRALGCEATARAVTLHLREDTPLDPAKVTELVRRPKSPYRLTPDMRLTRRFEGRDSGLANAETMLSELAACLKPGS